MIVTCREMKEIEERAFAAGASAETLMDDAGEQIALAIQQFFPLPAGCAVVFGKGHNGGDALVAARHLAEAGWTIVLHETFPRESLAPLTRKKLGELEPVLGLCLENSGRTAPAVVLDGLLGIGGKPGLREPILGATRAINRLRREKGAAVFAIDLPTGLDGDTGEAGSDAVEADFTLTIGFAKRGLVADPALNFVGRLAVLPLAGLTAQAGGADANLPESIATPHTLAGLRSPRRFGIHKGNCGRVGVIAGSRGLTGAAVMAANAAVRAGAGLVSLYVTPDAYPLIASSVMPEVMTSPVEEYREVLEHSLDVLAVGPGLGSNARHQDADGLLAVIEHFPGLMVVDADALNLVAASDGPSPSGARLLALQRRAGPRLLTPHPGEMRRLFPESENLLRCETARQFLALFAAEAEGAPKPPLTLLLKGSRTLVAEGGRRSYNSTGNPGMATGGMGDVLTGTCAALAGQGLCGFDAARVGAWVCGRAAEKAIMHGWRSQESLCATDLLEFFGGAFDELRGGGASW